MLDDAARRRQAAERRLLSVYEDELVRYRARVQSAKVTRDRARARHAWWAWLKLTAGVRREKRRIPHPPVPAAGHATDTEERIRAPAACSRSRSSTSTPPCTSTGTGGGPTSTTGTATWSSTVRNPTVLAGTSAGYALDLAEASASRLDREQRAAIKELIQRDHAFHGKPHRRAPSR